MSGAGLNSETVLIQSNSSHDYGSTMQRRSARVNWHASDGDDQLGVIEHQTQLVPIHRRR